MVVGGIGARSTYAPTWGGTTGAVTRRIALPQEGAIRMPQGSTGWLRLEPLLAVMLWGGVYPGVKLGLLEIPLLSFTYLRIVLAMAGLYAISRGEPVGADWRTLGLPLLRAGSAQAVFQLLLVAGVQRTTAGNSAILLATAPLLTAGWLAGRGQTRLSRRQWYGFGAGLLGVTLLVQRGGVAVAWSHLPGDLLALGAAGAWAWYGIAIGPLARILGPTRATGWTMAFAALCFTPLAVGEVGRYAWSSVSWQAWGGLLYGSTAGMMIAMTLWARAIQRLGPLHTMLYVYLEPVSAVIIAAILLREALSPLQIIGAVLTFLGVALASYLPEANQGS